MISAEVEKPILAWDNGNVVNTVQDSNIPVLNTPVVDTSNVNISNSVEPTFTTNVVPDNNLVSPVMNDAAVVQEVPVVNDVNLNNNVPIVENISTGIVIPSPVETASNINIVDNNPASPIMTDVGVMQEVPMVN